MNNTAVTALDLWGMAGANMSLFADRENSVFRIEWQGKRYAMRLHRQGYRTDAELQSELDWMAAVSTAGISVPAPIPAKDGKFLVVVDDIQVDVLNWLGGAPFDLASISPGNPRRRDHFRKLGEHLAKLHDASDTWTPEPNFTRPAWDISGLVGKAPLWGRFWENPSLSSTQRNVLEGLRSSAQGTLEGDRFDYGLIHADPVRENILVDGDALHFIDFDDGGFGYRLFDLATALVKSIDAPDHAALRHAMTDGYTSIRPLDTTQLDLFMALRAATYVGWIVPRMEEKDADTRNRRFIDAACMLAESV